jgi:signal transduction histidine kinase/PAS domain-containing protein
LQSQLDELVAEQSRLAAALHRAEQELERSAARFRDVIERNADAIVVVDSEGLIRFANAAATKLFGVEREDLLNRPFGFPLVAGETTEIDLRSHDEPRTAEMRVVESEWEGAKACIASLRDITERRRAEQNERELIREHAARSAAEVAARRLRFLLESSTLLATSLDYEATLTALARICVPALADWAVVYSVDEEGHVRRAEVAHTDPSKADLARELREAAIDQSDPSPVLAVLRDRASLLVTTASPPLLDSIAASERHREILRELGFESLMIVPMISHARPLGALALVSSRPSRRFVKDDLDLAEDVARRATLAMESARLFDEARRANEGKADFLAVVSHDLRTPLTAIMGYAELLELGVPEALSARAQQQVQRIRTSARHLLYLLNELLAFARLDAGREEVRRRQVDIRAIGLEVAAVMEPLAVARALQFHLDMPNEPVPALTDPDKLRQILLNLLGNAVKYSTRGDVHLEIDSEGASVRIRVRDTGIGIAAEHLPHIFQPFWQVDPTQRSRDGGTGLGLSVVQRLVALLSGHVAVTSVLGVGTTFTVRIPVGSAQGAD